MKINIYLYSNDSRFFYKINTRLKQLHVPFDILNSDAKLKVNGIILTTKKEFDEISPKKQSNQFLIYSNIQDFEEYIMHVLASHKFGFRKRYSDLIFSIDPGRNKSGMAIFLDEYFLISKVVFNQENLLDNIRKFISYYNADDSIPLYIKIFFGVGVPSLVESILQALSEEFKKNLPISYLVDERYTSKIKYNKKILKISKHEISAIWIAIRGINAIKTTEIINGITQNSQIMGSRKLNSNIKFDENLTTEVYLGNLSISNLLKKE